jgi:hypothetical protein
LAGCRAPECAAEVLPNLLNELFEQGRLEIVFRLCPGLTEEEQVSTRHTTSQHQAQRSHVQQIRVNPQFRLSAAQYSVIDYVLGAQMFLWEGFVDIGF